MNNGTLLILGAGGHALSVADAALAEGRWKTLAFLDDSREGALLGFPIIGRFDDAERLRESYPSAFVAIGDNTTRLAWHHRLKAWGYALPAIVHPAAHVSPSAVIGAGCVLMAGAILNAQSSLGEACILNTGCTVDHSCTLGDGVHLSPGVHTGGDVQIGARTWLCTGASIGNRVSICADCVVAAGAAVVRDITLSGLYAGIPARHKQ